MKGKYIVGWNGSGSGQLEAVLFSTEMIHADAALLFRARRVVGAGFFELIINGEGKPDCILFGRSESLDVDMSQLDRFYVRRALGLEQSPLTDDVRRTDREIARTIMTARVVKSI